MSHAQPMAPLPGLDPRGATIPGPHGPGYTTSPLRGWRIATRCLLSRSRRGFSLIELIVAATLLVTLLGVVAPLAVRSGRLWQDSRHHQLALDELSNQLERLTTLENADLEQALAGLTPSEPIQHAFPNPSLTGETVDDADGRRLVLSLQWDRVGPAPPLTLVAWLAPPGAAAEEALR